MHHDSGVRRAFCERGVLRGQEFDFVVPLAQSLQRQQRLALPAAPLALQVREQDSHS
jgi:hypothetical protein